MYSEFTNYLRHPLCTLCTSVQHLCWEIIEPSKMHLCVPVCNSVSFGVKLRVPIDSFVTIYVKNRINRGFFNRLPAGRWWVHSGCWLTFCVRCPFCGLLAFSTVLSSTVSVQSWMFLRHLSAFCGVLKFSPSKSDTQFSLRNTCSR